MSRLGPVPVEAPHAERVAAHAARGGGGRVLVTGPTGHWTWLSETDYRRYLKGGVSNEEPLGAELRQKGFFRDYQDFRSLARREAQHERLGQRGPSEHALVLSGPGGRMAPEDVRRAVDLAFAFPAPMLAFTLVAAGPADLPAARLAEGYAKLKNRAQKRGLSLALRAAPAAFDAAAVSWAAAAGVSAELFFDGAAAAAALERLQKAGVPALALVPSAGEPEELAARLAEAGAPRARLELEGAGPDSAWADFAASFVDALAKGGKVREELSASLLGAILRGHPAAPGRPGLHRLAYGPDGAVYAGREGWRLAQAGDDLLRLGRLGEVGFADVVASPVTRAAWLASSPLAQPLCGQCAYAPFCPRPPLDSLLAQGGLWGHMPTNGACARLMSLLDHLFLRIGDTAFRQSIERWLQPLA